ncbi:MAG: hypothetical protein ACKO4M_05430, partial [Betaproteobacteria bacterium]
DQPYYDDLPAAKQAQAVYPVFHVLSSLNCASGAKLRSVSIASADKAAALGWENAEGRWLLLANLTAEKQTIRLKGVGAQASIGVLDAASFAEATSAPIAFRKRSRWLGSGNELVLDAYAVACIFER